MKSNSSFWLMTVLINTMFLCSCALNNKIEIESSESYRSSFPIGEFEFRFPSQPHIRFVPMHGATWAISGDLSDIFSGVVAELSALGFEGLSNQIGSYMEIKSITVRYQDEMPGGPDTYLSVALKLQFYGNYNGQYIDSCKEVEAIPEYPPAVSHGVFASRDKLRPMIQPVYEDLIKEALTEALVAGLNCLSKESQIKQTN